MNSRANEVVASLEGMRIVTKGRICSLHEYNFETNSWNLVETDSLPIDKATAEKWVNGWNGVDRSAALTLLTYSEIE